MKQKLFCIAVCALILITGVVIGCVWGNVPFFTLDPQLNLVEVANFVLGIFSLLVAIWIGVNVTKILQSNQAIAAYLASELDALVNLTKNVHKIIADTYSVGSFQARDRDALVHAFYDVELKIDSIENQMSVAHPKEASSLIQPLKDAFFVYKNHLTGGDIMLSSFTVVSDACYKDCQTQHMKLETVVKKTLFAVHRL